MADPVSLQPQFLVLFPQNMPTHRHRSLDKSFKLSHYAFYFPQRASWCLI